MAAQQPAQGAAVLPSGSRVVVVVSSGPATTPPAAYVAVPDVGGAKQGDALGAAQDAGFSTQVFNDYSDTYKRGTVMGQYPPAGASAPSGAELIFLVSSGPAAAPVQSVVLPDVAGRTEAEAVTALQQASFSPQVVHQPSPNVPEGVVISQLPSRQSLAAAPAKGVPAWVWVVAAAVVVILAVVAFFALGGSGQKVAVPNVVGLTQAEAQAALVEVGLVGETTSVEADGEPGTVVAQDPVEGTEVDEGSTVKLDVIGEPKSVAVPDVVKLNQADATKALEDAGFVVKTSRADSSLVDKGLVIEQTPQAGTQAQEGSVVEIVISNGPASENVKVPNVEGLTRADAEKALTDLGLKVVVAENPSSDVAKDVVISQLPAAGDSVAPGTSVGIIVSTGPPPTANTVEVPDVVGLTLAEAQTVMSDAGFEALPVPSTGSGKPANEVIAQTPEGKTQAQDGSTVVLFYSTGP